VPTGPASTIDDQPTMASDSREERRLRKAEARTRAQAQRARERVGRAAVAADRAARRVRMTGPQRREQLIEVAMGLLEIAAEAGVSKPIVYEHFGSKDGLFAVIVDREVGYLLGALEAALDQPHPVTGCMPR